MKVILIIIGTISVCLGVLGIFLPILPTTPLLLLGAACYIRSSQKLYDKLLSSKLLGGYIASYREGKGLPVRTKFLVLFFLWLSILYSAFYIIQSVYIRLLLIAIASGVTYHIVSYGRKK
ncbi:MAG: YbaN family protein [Bacillota bacterium]